MKFFVEDGLVVRDASQEDAAYIADHMRAIDKREIWASDRIVPKEAMEKSLELSQMCMTAELYGTPVCMMGVVPQTLLSRIGSIWMLGCDQIDFHKTKTARSSRLIVNKFLSRYDMLYNYVLCENTRTIRWLKWLGATFYNPEPYGPFKMHFRFFTLSRS